MSSHTHRISDRRPGKLIDQGQFSISVIVAHMACEVATELDPYLNSFAAKGIQHLEDTILEFLNGYNLANDRIGHCSRR